ncbi:DUF1707 SHOCT-like domain-containing protein [Microtetraspora malaysiensis]|uniref:DUF1707 SHOCT-like domain-containing protein n=1 Tax=Microtetraspora malaysiensis TaxID=161358 RepID=UPI000AE8FDEB|nr:DUF1707 domain-containing protein [Microtetraspora malaysiensis]
MSSSEQPSSSRPERPSTSRPEPAPRDGLRIGDRERDEVTAALHDAFAQGRITREELDERLDATLAAKTEGDLRRVTADLPGGYGREPGGGQEGARWAPGHRGHPGGAGHLPWAADQPEHGPRDAGTGHRPWTAVGPGLAPWAARGPGHRPGPWGLGPALWSRHAAEARRGPYGRRRGGPPPVAFLIVAGLVTAALVSGVTWPLFAALKLLFFAWIAMAVLGFAHHRRFPRNHRHSGRS